MCCVAGTEQLWLGDIIAVQGALHKRDRCETLPPLDSISTFLYDDGMSKAQCIRRTEVQPFAFGDLQIFDYRPGCETSASVALVQLKPGIAHGRTRSTRSDKYYYVLAGLVEFEVGEIIYWLSQGDLLIIPRGIWFDYRNSGPEPVTLLLIHTPPFRLEAEEFASEKRDTSPRGTKG